MAFKEFQLEGVGPLTVYKRRGTRSLRLSVRHDGSLRVSIPIWMPYAAGVEFAHSRRSWIAAHAQPTSEPLADNQLIGKAHHLRFVASTGALKPQSRLKASEIAVTYPMHYVSSDAAVQKVAHAASIRALRNQAEQLLPLRLQELAAKHGFFYRSVAIKQLKSRWGSCDQDKNIILNLFLMQLPWQLIDYVLLHELTHTKVMKHGPIFWKTMTEYDSQTSAHRRAIRAHKPTL